jgi:aspartate carbamoyltransferase regulatory subunit
MGKKDFIKIEDYHPKSDDLNKIALIAPDATISVIKNGDVVEKGRVEVPKEYSGKLMCINPRCVTKTEKYLTPSYIVESVRPLSLRCKFCDKVLNEEDVVTQTF